jgi:hypothetical protein
MKRVCNHAFKTVQRTPLKELKGTSGKRIRKKLSVKKDDLGTILLFPFLPFTLLSNTSRTPL